MKITQTHPFGLMIEPENKRKNIESLNVHELRDFVRQESIVTLRGFESFQNSNEFSTYCEEFGEVSVWPFGKVLELVEQNNPADHIFDHSYVPMHWDGMYRTQVPEFQIFHCVSAPQLDQGGRTTFSHTPLAIAHTETATRRLWEKATITYKRKMEFYDSKTVAPIIDKHPEKGFPVIRYCEPPFEGDENFVNHSEFEYEGISCGEIKLLHSTLRDALYNPKNFYAHTWQTGDVVITNNYTLLHGREAFTSGAARHLRRVHVLGSPPLKNPHLVSHK